MLNCKETRRRVSGYFSISTLVVYWPRTLQFISKTAELLFVLTSHFLGAVAVSDEESRGIRVVPIKTTQGQQLVFVNGAMPDLSFPSMGPLGTLPYLPGHPTYFRPSVI